MKRLDNSLNVAQPVTDRAGTETRACGSKGQALNADLFSDLTCAYDLVGYGVPSKVYTQKQTYPTRLLFIPVLVLLMEISTALIGPLVCALLLCKWVKRMETSGYVAFT